MKKSSKGFTLVELIVVIAIIGILAAILVPALMGYIKDSKLTSANASAKTVYTAASNYAQKCTTAGYKIPQAVYGGNVTGNSGDSIALPTGTNDNWTTLMGGAIEGAMGEDAKGSSWKVSINSKGFPAASAWAKTSSDIYVGMYPDEATDSTDGCIASVLTSESTEEEDTPAPTPEGE